ncbi:MAG: ArnT family glycosyltransferase [Planctomycetota bacterium]
MDPRPTTRGAAWWLLPLLLIYLGAGVWDRDLWGDELRVAGIAREMSEGGSWVVPTLAGRPFLEKPPCVFSAVALSSRLLGWNRVAPRLPSLVCGLAGAAFLGLLARDLYESRAAGLATCGLLLASSEWFWKARQCMVDPPLAAAVIASVWALRRGFAPGPRSWRWLVGGALAAGCAFCAKGAIGLVIPALAALGLLLGREGRLRENLARPALWASPLLVVALVAGWLLALYAEGGAEAVRVLVVDNHLKRFSPDAAYTGGHQQPWHYYLSRLPAVLLPSLLLLPASLRWHARERAARPELREALWLAATWFGAGLALLSLAGTKRITYLLPLLPALSLLAGGWLGRALEGAPLDRLEAWTLRLGAGVLVLAALVALPALCLALGVSPDALGVLLWLGALAAAAGAALALRRDARRAFLARAGAALVCAYGLGLGVVAAARSGEEEHPPAFYREVAALVPPEAPLWATPREASLGALSFYAARIPRIEPSVDESRRRLAGREPYYLLLVEKDAPAKGSLSAELAAPPGVRVLASARNGRFTSTLLANVGPAEAAPTPIHKAPERS